MIRRGFILLLLALLSLTIVSTTLALNISSRKYRHNMPQYFHHNTIRFETQQVSKHTPRDHKGQLCARTQVGAAIYAEPCLLPIGQVYNYERIELVTPDKPAIQACGSNWERVHTHDGVVGYMESQYIGSCESFATVPTPVIDQTRVRDPRSPKFRLNNCCGETSLVMAMLAQNPKLDISVEGVAAYAILNRFFDPEDPLGFYTTPVNLTNIAQHYCRQVHSGQGGSSITVPAAKYQALLLEQISAGRDVIVDVRVTFTATDHTHFVVVNGIDPSRGEVLLTDPFTCCVRSSTLEACMWKRAACSYVLTWEEFDRSWNSNPDNVDRWWMSCEL